MPELPEVETIRLALDKIVKNALVKKVEIYRYDLRWKVKDNLKVHLEKDILKKARVNKVFDRLNQRYGSGTICVAKENYEKFYITRRKNLSPAYTSSFNDLPIVN